MERKRLKDLDGYLNLLTGTAVQRREALQHFSDLEPEEQNTVVACISKLRGMRCSTYVDELLAELCKARCPQAEAAEHLNTLHTSRASASLGVIAIW